MKGKTDDGLGVGSVGFVLEGILVLVLVLVIGMEIVGSEEVVIDRKGM